MQKEMVRAENIVKSYDGVRVLNGVSLSVARGELVALLGANGAGKTTLINILMGFVQPDSGYGFVDLIDVQRDTRRARERIAYIPENVALYPDLTALEHMELFGPAAPHTSFNKRAAALRTAGLEPESFSRRVSTFSKGMRQKVGLALSLIRAVDTLLMDEPLAGLDPSAANDFNECVARFKADGKAILMATHDIFNACEVATRIAILRRGKLVAVLDNTSLSATQVREIYLEHMH